MCHSGSTLHSCGLRSRSMICGFHILPDAIRNIQIYNTFYGVPPNSPNHEYVHTENISNQTHREACSPTMNGDVWHYTRHPETFASAVLAT